MLTMPWYNVDTYLTCIKWPIASHFLPACIWCSLITSPIRFGYFKMDQTTVSQNVSINSWTRCISRVRSMYLDQPFHTDLLRDVDFYIGARGRISKVSTTPNCKNKRRCWRDPNGFSQSFITDAQVFSSIKFHDLNYLWTLCIYSWLITTSYS